MCVREWGRDLPAGALSQPAMVVVLVRDCSGWKGVGMGVCLWEAVSTGDINDRH